MNKYTIQLKEIIEVENIDIFDFQYTFYDETMKQELQDNFISNYYYDEIGSETVERFLKRLKTKWLKIIKKYNQLFQVNDRLLTEFDPITTFKGENTMVFNDTPMGEVTQDNKHITNYTVTNNKGYNDITSTELFKQYTNDYIDIMEVFIDEFKDLFMLIY